MSNAPFLYVGGHHTGPLTLRYSTHLDQGPDACPYVIDLHSATMLTMNSTHAVDLMLSIAECLYDRDALPMEAAERMQYLAGSVIVDSVAAVPQKCPNCGGNGATGPDYDPDPCNACRGTGIKA